MIHPEFETLLQGALDDTLTHHERERLAKLLAENREARDRAAELKQLASLIESLGAADAPPALAQNVLTQISHRPHSIRPLTFQRGVIVNKKILFGLAAAAAIVLAVITYNSNPPATVGTEATIGAAQRAQAPQIASSDVKLGDTSTQDVLQTEEWDQILKDQDLRTALQDENFRTNLLDVEYRNALADATLLRGIQTREFAEHMKAQALVKKLDEAALISRAREVSLKAVYSNRAFMRSLNNSPSLRSLFARPGVAQAVAKSSFQASLRNGIVDRGIREAGFATRLARAAKAY